MCDISMWFEKRESTNLLTAKKFFQENKFIKMTGRLEKKACQTSSS
jgi:hypothetical protein